MEIRITAKSQYGRTVFYPANVAATHLADIARTQTLTPEALRSARAMGATITLDGNGTLDAMLASVAR